jgi:hypothetical protein
VRSFIASGTRRGEAAFSLPRTALLAEPDASAIQSVSALTRLPFHPPRVQLQLQSRLPLLSSPPLFSQLSQFNYNTSSLRTTTDTTTRSSPYPPILPALPMHPQLVQGVTRVGGGASSSLNPPSAKAKASKGPLHSPLSPISHERRRVLTVDIVFRPPRHSSNLSDLSHVPCKFYRG